MGRTITLDVPDEVYESLLKEALQEGRKPEDVAAEWLATAAQRQADDPLLQLSGILDADVTDLAERHDHYLGLSLIKESGESENG